MSNFLPKTFKPHAIINDQETYKYVNHILGYELSSVSKSCYYPKMTKYFSDLQKYTGIDNTVIADFKSHISKQYAHFDIYNDKYTILLVIAVLYYMKKKKYDIAKAFFQLLSIKFYSSRLHLHFPKFCNDDLWIMALDSLSPRHLFHIKGGVGSAIIYISDTDFEKNRIKLLNEKITDKDLVMIVYGLRTRIAQSTRSFAELYYKLQKEKFLKTTEEEGESVLEVQLVADKYSMLICTYGQIDKDALNLSIIQSGIRKEVAISIISGIAVPQHKDQVRFIFILIGRLDNFNVVCTEIGRNKLVRKISSDTKVADKYLIKEEIKKLIFSLEFSYQFKSIHDMQLIMFMSHYLTLFLKNRVC